MSDSPRPDVVEKLIHGALHGMLSSVESCTANEVMSAYFTMTKRGIRAALAANPGPLTRAALQHTLMELMVETVDPSAGN